MIDILNAGIYGVLVANSALTALLSSGSAIYFHQAPANTPKPYVVYIHAGGGDDHLTPTESGDAMYYIKGIAATPTRAGQIAAALRTALHEKETSFSLTSPWVMYRSQADSILAYAETTDGVQAWHMGNAYRFRLSQ